MLLNRIRLAAAAVFLLASLSAYAAPKAELIFPVGSTSFAGSHASTVVQLKDGHLLSAWFGGTAEGKPDVAIWSSRQDANGSWSTPVELAREPNIPCWNPVLFHTRDGRLWLYYKFGPSPSTWTASRKFSDDEGKSWSAAEYLPAGLLGPIRAKPLVLKDGTIVSGSSVESYHSWAVWIERSTDGGKTWAKIGPLVPTLDKASAQTQGAPVVSEAKNNTGIIQPSVVQLGPKHLRFYARSTSNIARVAVADSYDKGVTWSKVHLLDVLNPNSGIDAVALRDGRVVLIYNNTTKGRTPLNLAVSTDGEHFTMFKTLEDQPGEYSYPALIQVANGDLEMTYTWNRKTIKHVHLALADVPKPSPSKDQR